MKHRIALLCSVAGVLLCAAAQAAAPTPTPMKASAPAALDVDAAARFAALALKCLHQEYPNHVSHTLNDEADARPPCADAGVLRLPRLAFGRARALVGTAGAALPRGAVCGTGTHATRGASPRQHQRRTRHLRGEGRASFERPYGLAWLLQLAAELRAWNDPEARAWLASLAPLESEAAARLRSWLPKLHYPIRIGEHDQTAFSFGLAWDWAAVAQDAPMRELLRDAAQRFYLHDRNCPLSYEPSGEDFLSPCLAEADFVRRVLARKDFARWLSGFLPQIPHDATTAWLPPGVVTDRADPKLAHVDGLNLSRAWILQGIAHGLPAGDPRRAALLATARAHAAAALPAVTGEHYEGGHWLGTFAVYLTSGAGVGAPP
jgi:hypothetical protein